METYSWYDVCKAVYMKSESFTFLDPASLVFFGDSKPLQVGADEEHFIVIFRNHSDSRL